MKIRAQDPLFQLPLGPAQSLNALRQLRGFDASSWLEAKQAAIEDYFEKSQLKSAVIGVSGGIDSALVAALFARMLQDPKSGIERVELLAMPSLGDDGVTGQGHARTRALELGESLNLDVRTINVLPGAAPLREQLHIATDIAPSPWAKGQGIAVMRTFVLYQTAALLTQSGTPGLVIGTTNRDEGAYLGYVGKSSDGMVDLQVISDLHKSEVREVSRLLNVPLSILNIEPTGDMFDACPDTAVFGAPYDAVELLILSRTLWSDQKWQEEQLQWSSEDQAIWKQMEQNLENLHRYNAHKYNVGSPAIHLDVLDSAMPGGWSPASPQSFMTPSTLQSHRPAPRALGGGDRRKWIEALSCARQSDQNALKIEIPQLLSVEGLTVLRHHLHQGLWQSTNQQGRWQDGVLSDQPYASPGIGSWRTTFEDAAFAQALWEQLRLVLPNYRMSQALSRFDGKGARVWKPIGVNPVFRAIRYEVGGVLVPHYDGPFEVTSRVRSGMSLVIYLDTDNNQGGALRWIKDPHLQKPWDQCNGNDWSRFPHADEIESTHQPKPGSAWVFDHRQLHDSSLLTSGSKILLRSDIFFEKIGP